MTINKTLSALMVASMLASLPMGQAMGEPFVGEIRWFGFTFCPRGWANADGQLLSIADNTALFSLYGTIYGGDGRTTFGLPDLRGRVSVHVGTGPGLSSYAMGSRGGQEEVTLTAAQMPGHNHALNASPDANDRNAAGSVLGSPHQRIYDPPAMATTTLHDSAIGDAGGGGGHENRPPYLTLRACVALEGIFPSRN